jgi:hypothetical protein
MFVVVIILGFVAVAMAKKSPGTQAEQSLPPDTSLPSLGATDKFSPALSGNSHLIATDNRLRLGMAYQNSPTVTDKMPPRRIELGTLVGIRGGLTDAQSSLKTQEVPPLVENVTTYNPRMFMNRTKL